MLGIIRRILMNYGRVRPEMAPGCPEQIDWPFVRFVWTYRAVARPKLLAFLSRLRDNQRLVTFTTRRQAVRFLADVRAT